nr:hypothetical protein [uncultured bacterium]
MAARRKSTRSRGRKSVSRNTAGKRTLVAPRGNKRFVRRDKNGRFKKVVDVGRSLSADRRSKSNRKAKPGQGDRGDR